MRPKRADELIGGSLYWIVKHRLVACQQILRFEDRKRRPHRHRLLGRAGADPAEPQARPPGLALSRGGRARRRSTATPAASPTSRRGFTASWRRWRWSDLSRWGAGVIAALKLNNMEASHDPVLGFRGDRLESRRAGDAQPSLLPGVDRRARCRSTRCAIMRGNISTMSRRSRARSAPCTAPAPTATAGGCWPRTSPRKRASRPASRTMRACG